MHNTRHRHARVGRRTRSPGVLHDGTVVRFTNDGFLIHVVGAARARNLADAGKIAALLKAGQDGQAEHLAMGFTTFAGPMSHGRLQQMVLHAPKRYWVLACFMDTQDGRGAARGGPQPWP
jgi:glycine cleavage system aminomethyltransferase T